MDKSTDGLTDRWMSVNHLKSSFCTLVKQQWRLEQDHILQAWKAPQKWLINPTLLLQVQHWISTYLDLDDKFLLVEHDDSDWTPRQVLGGGGSTSPRWHGHRLRHGAASTSAVSLTPSSPSQCHVLYHHPAPTINTAYPVNRSSTELLSTLTTDHATSLRSITPLASVGGRRICTIKDEKISGTPYMH